MPYFSNKPPLTMYYCYRLERQELCQFIEYMSRTIKLRIPEIGQNLGKDRSRLEVGLEFF
ncbi:hypothetical protein [Dapis sp. BLCC M229]|uniref:hypothetical protein n=1 Tax=Dapis sp. BLCC M229 TaxID=3400188 RepID=UPI003CECB6C9